jgi:exocyst complex component 2
MALDIVKLYATQMCEFFEITEINAPPSKGPSTPFFLPAGSNSLTTSHFLTKLISEINDCVNDVVAVELSSEANTLLQNLLQNARWRFEEVLYDVWKKGAFAPWRTVHQPD